MPLAVWHTATVTGIQQLAPFVKSFTLTLNDLEEFSFKAGQFITFDLPVGDKRSQRWRSYSIASAPKHTNTIELCIVHYEHGLGSSYFFNIVTLGSELKFKGPEGGFVLSEPIQHDLVMICTGTGVAPFRSMIWDIHLQQKPHKNIHLIFGTRWAKDVLYTDEWIYMQNNLPGFSVDFALSREVLLPEGDQYHNGYVHAIYTKAYKNKRTDVRFLICGWSKMIDEAVVKLFSDIGYDRSQILYELYG